MIGFNLIKNNNLESTSDIETLESVLMFELPALFKVFMQSFEVGNSNINWNRFLNPKNGFKSPSGSIKYLPLENARDLFFHGFFNCKELINDWQLYSHRSTEFSEYGMLRIGSIGMGGGLFIGINESNKDQIFRVVWDWDESYELLAENVFEFVKNLVFVEDFSNMDKIKYEQFYKNWGEDFWRVR